MIRLFSALVIVIAFAISADSQPSFGAAQYINTNGEPIKVNDMHCRPQYKMADGRTMVFENNKTDIALLISKMKSEGINDPEELNPILIADSYDCEKKSTKECSKGTCKTGSCKYNSTGNFASCKCK